MDDRNFSAEGAAEQERGKVIAASKQFDVVERENPDASRGETRFSLVLRRDADGEELDRLAVATEDADTLRDLLNDADLGVQSFGAARGSMTPGRGPRTQTPDEWRGGTPRGLHIHRDRNGGQPRGYDVDEESQFAFDNPAQAQEASGLLKRAIEEKKNPAPAVKETVPAAAGPTVSVETQPILGSEKVALSEGTHFRVEKRTDLATGKITFVILRLRKPVEPDIIPKPQQERSKIEAASLEALAEEVAKHQSARFGYTDSSPLQMEKISEVDEANEIIAAALEAQKGASVPELTEKPTEETPVAEQKEAQELRKYTGLQHDLVYLDNGQIELRKLRDVEGNPIPADQHTAIRFDSLSDLNKQVEDGSLMDIPVEELKNIGETIDGAIEWEKEGIEIPSAYEEPTEEAAPGGPLAIREPLPIEQVPGIHAEPTSREIVPLAPEIVIDISGLPEGAGLPELPPGPEGTPESGPTIDSTAAELAKLQAALEELQKQLADVQATNAEEKAALEAELQTLLEQITGLTEENERLKAEKAELEERLAQVPAAAAMGNVEAIRNMAEAQEERVPKWKATLRKVVEVLTAVGGSMAARAVVTAVVGIVAGGAVVATGGLAGIAIAAGIGAIGGAITGAGLNAFIHYKLFHPEPYKMWTENGAEPKGLLAGLAVFRRTLRNALIKVYGLDGRLDSLAELHNGLTAETVAAMSPADLQANLLQLITLRKLTNNAHLDGVSHGVKFQRDGQTVSATEGLKSLLDRLLAAAATKDIDLEALDRESDAAVAKVSGQALRHVARSKAAAGAFVGGVFSGIMKIAENIMATGNILGEIRNGGEPHVEPGPSKFWDKFKELTTHTSKTQDNMLHQWGLHVTEFDTNGNGIIDGKEIGVLAQRLAEIKGAIVPVVEVPQAGFTSYEQLFPNWVADGGEHIRGLGWIWKEGAAQHGLFVDPNGPAGMKALYDTFAKFHEAGVSQAALDSMNGLDAFNAVLNGAEVGSVVKQFGLELGGSGGAGVSADVIAKVTAELTKQAAQVQGAFQSAASDVFKTAAQHGVIHMTEAAQLAQNPEAATVLHDLTIGAIGLNAAGFLGQAIYGPEQDQGPKRPARKPATSQPTDTTPPTVVSEPPTDTTPPVSGTDITPPAGEGEPLTKEPESTEAKEKQPATTEGSSKPMSERINDAAESIRKFGERISRLIETSTRSLAAATRNTQLAASGAAVQQDEEIQRDPIHKTRIDPTAPGDTPLDLDVYDRILILDSTHDMGEGNTPYHIVARISAQGAGVTIPPEGSSEEQWRPVENTAVKLAREIAAGLQSPDLLVAAAPVTVPPEQLATLTNLEWRKPSTPMMEIRTGDIVELANIRFLIRIENHTMALFELGPAQKKMSR